MEEECELEGAGDEQGEEEGKRSVLKMLVKLPSRAEIEEHELTHLPFRNWCRHCVKGRARKPHTRSKRTKNL